MRFVRVTLCVLLGLTALLHLVEGVSGIKGVFLARFVALTVLLSAPVLYLKLQRPEFAIGDLVHGLLLLVPAMLVKVQGDPRR